MKNILKLTKFLSFSLAVSLIFGSCAPEMEIYDGNLPTLSGTNVVIRSTEQLALIGTSGSYPMDGNYYLASDLDLLNASWTPIGTIDNPFTGTFSGEGYTISNISISIDDTALGLFGYVSGGTIKKLILKSVTITGAGSYAGAICGSIDSSGIIMQCGVTSGSISQGTYAGGIAGYALSSSITACYSVLSVTCSSAAGGIVGCINSSIIKSCYNTGAVSATNKGGIIGYYDGGTSYINESYYIASSAYNSYGTAVTTLTSLNSAVNSMSGNYFTTYTSSYLPSLFGEKTIY